ncbi:MFS transporter [Uniformispora flossi]|uniref:MFS transporter n=1 Tax=Uniformispora flossi TaxID=3390723 RepID=UPI003C2AB8AA
MPQKSLPADFTRLWFAYAISTLGTYLALDAFPLVALTVLDASTTQISLLASVGLAVGALVAVPLGPWVEFRRKRPVMIGADVVRFAALMTLPVAYLFGAFSFAQMMAVSTVIAAADIVFLAASGACLKALVPPDQLLLASGRYEATLWTSSVVGPPLGGAAIGILGPLATIVANAVSFLLSALGVRAIRTAEPEPPAKTAHATEQRNPGLTEGWRYILRHPVLRPLFVNSVLMRCLILGTGPLLAVLMLRIVGVAPWQYGLAFGIACLGGLVGSRLSRLLVARHGERRVLLGSGVLRVCWPVLLAFVGPGWWGVVLVVAVEFVLITCIGVFNPVFAAYRLRSTDSAYISRVLAAWSVTNNAAVALSTVAWGLLASVIGVREGLALAGVLLLATPLVLPWRATKTTTVTAAPVVRESAAP